MLERGNLLGGHNGTYLIDSLIDRGGLGAVYKAQRVTDRLRVAVKVLHGGRFPMTAVARERFRAEISRALALKHPCLVESYDYGKHEGDDFLVMEYLGAGTVAKHVEARSYDDGTAFRWCAQLLSGLSYLHSKGCIHRDLKPNNLLLTSSEDLKIADLGIVRDLSADAYLTLSGDQIGSVLYISRHQREAPGDADVADDAHSAACCLYEILSRSRIHVYPEHLRRAVGASVPQYVCDLIMDCLAGAEPIEALAELGRVFTRSKENRDFLAPWAYRPVLNELIFPLNASGHNLGLERRRFVERVPLQLHGEIRVPNGRKDGPFHVEYMTESVLLLCSESGDGNKVNAHVVEKTDSGLSLLGSTRMYEPRLIGRDYRGRLITAGGSEISVYELGEGPDYLRKAASYRINEAAFHTMALSLSPDAPMIAVGSWTDAPFLVNTDNGTFRQLQTLFKGNWDLGETAFIGQSRLIVQYEGELVTYDIDTDSGIDVIVYRWPFPEGLTAIATGRHEAFAGHGNGLTAIALDTGARKWSLTLPSVDIRQVRLDPTGKTLAVLCGMIDSRALLIDTNGVCFAYAPDTSERDTFLGARHLAWAPSGRTLAISDRNGVLSVYKISELQTL